MIGWQKSLIFFKLFFFKSQISTLNLLKDATELGKVHEFNAPLLSPEVEEKWLEISSNSCSDGHTIEFTSNQLVLGLKITVHVYIVYVIKYKINICAMLKSGYKADGHPTLNRKSLERVYDPQMYFFHEPKYVRTKSTL